MAAGVAAKKNTRCFDVIEKVMAWLSVIRGFDFPLISTESSEQPVEEPFWLDGEGVLAKHAGGVPEEGPQEEGGEPEEPREDDGGILDEVEVKKINEKTWYFVVPLANAV